MQRSSIALVALLLTFGLAACGGDDEPSSGGGGGAEATADQATLEITAGGDAKAPTFEVAGDLRAGLTEISLTNDTKGEIDGQLVRVDGDHELKEVLGQLRNAFAGKPVEDWFQARGGVGPIPGGETHSVEQVLEAGTYYVLGGEDVPQNPPSFEITGEGGGELPDAGNAITATDYEFTGAPKAGQPLTFVNDGEEWHHFIGAPIKGDATLDEVEQFFRTEKGQPPVDFANSINSTVMDGGVSQTIDGGLEPGRYAFVCFISDRKGGPPHIAKGMLSEITVK